MGAPSVSASSPALLVALADDAASSAAVSVLEQLSSLGLRLHVGEQAGAERWFGRAALDAAAVRCGATMHGGEAVAAILLLGRADAEAEWRAAFPGTPILLHTADDSVSAAVARVARQVGTGVLRGCRVLVTAGPTVEHFDAVRFLSNPSSGKMGYAVAEAAWRAGAEVVLISGPTALAAPYGVQRVGVTSAKEMHAAVLAERHDLVFMAAAVSDYRPSVRAPGKVKKSEGPWVLEMERTPDILADLSSSNARPRWLVGFAAETEDLERYARGKLVAKRLDGIVANDVGAGGAFGSDRNRVECYDAAGGRLVLGPDSKQAVAAGIVAWAAAGLMRVG